MKNNFLNTVKEYLNKGHERSVRAKKNILALIIIRGLGILISLILVPITLDYVDNKTYGIWLTLSSIVAWISFFDIGLNNGLRNKYSEAMALGKVDLAQKYVSTTYAILSLIFIPLLIIFIIINNFIDWTSILNTPTDMSDELRLVALIVVSYFCLKFILSTINIILLAEQKPAGSSFRGLIEQVVVLLLIFILTKVSTGSLLKLSFALCISPLIVLFYFNLVLFRKRFKHVKPRIECIDFSLSKDLFGLGVKFFIIQVAGIVQFQTANVIIINYFGAEEVTFYNIAFKYFSILTMGMGVLIAPLWSSVTEAYTKGDYEWIRSISKKYLKVSFLVVFCGLIMLIFSNSFYDFWIGKDKVEIPFILSLSMFIYSSLNVTGSIFVGILNGIGELKTQFIASLFSPFIFGLLVIVFIKVFNEGIHSVVMASIIANYNAYLLAPLQYKRIFNSKR